jgi:hypothetical protein
MRRAMRFQWKLRRRTDKSLRDLANMFNPIIRGWIHYYGRYRRSALYPVFRHLDLALATWAMRKIKSLKGHRRRALRWLAAVKSRDPSLFAHWHLLGSLLKTG